MPAPHSLLFVCLILTACVSPPEPRAEKIDAALTIPPAYSADGLPAPEIVNSLLELFQDAALEALIDQALANNPDLLASAAKMQEAGFLFKKAQGARLPTVSAKASALRAGSNTAATQENFTAGLDVSWEVDIWGTLRNRSAAASAQLAGAQFIYQASRQSLAAQTMQSWFELVAAGKLLDIAEAERDSFAATHHLVERRYAIGSATQTELELVHTDAANARADYQISLKARDQAARALQVLLGSYPDAQLTSNRAWPDLERSIPSGLPSQLLLSRPDLIAAYENIRVSDANARVAYAELFPSFTLTTSGGRSSKTLSDIGRSAFDIWSLASGITAPLFQAGQLRAELAAAQQRAEFAYHNYRSTVLNALREVENALQSETALASEESARLQALAAAQRAAAQSVRQYQLGLIDLLELLPTQRRVFGLEKQVIQLHRARLNNRVTLALSLGTGL